MSRQIYGLRLDSFLDVEILTEVTGRPLIH